LFLGMSENLWLKGWKNDIRRRMNRETLIASSMRFGLSNGPSIISCSVSKFHFVESFVSITYGLSAREQCKNGVILTWVSSNDAWKVLSSICILIFNFTCSTCLWPRRTASSTEFALSSPLICSTMWSTKKSTLGDCS
jgi:hypothetical protein